MRPVTTSYHLSQVNVGRLIAPLDSEQIRPFMELLAPINAIADVAPGFESPTVSPLRDSGWSAVRAMVPRADTNRVMDELWEVGARAILVTEIHACRL